MDKTSPKSNRGFAGMDPEKQRAIASKGGKSVPAQKRSFSQNRELAQEAGRKGGHATPKEKLINVRNPEHAAAIGRLGGIATAKKNREPPDGQR